MIDQRWSTPQMWGYKATGAGGATGGVALALSMVLGGLGLMLLRRQGKSKI